MINVVLKEKNTIVSVLEAAKTWLDQFYELLNLQLCVVLIQCCEFLNSNISYKTWLLHHNKILAIILKV